MKQIIEKAYAKINLGLKITGKRSDGYHLLSMLMQTVSLYDRVGIYRTNEQDEISMDMDFGGAHPEEEITCDGSNLCVKAARLICSRLPESHGYYIHLVKNIPAAAGMAGGSSDAAAVLRGINSIESGYFSDEELRRMAVELGADVPYCISGGLCLCEGIGEDITPINAEFSYPILLAKPQSGVSTPDAYRWFDGSNEQTHIRIDAVIDGIGKNDIEKIKENMHNDLEGAARHFCPEIDGIERSMMDNGALISQVTGSGPTVYGIFADADIRSTAAAALRQHYPGCSIFLVEAVRPDYAGEAERK